MSSQGVAVSVWWEEKQHALLHATLVVSLIHKAFTVRPGVEAKKLHDIGVILSRNENPGHFDTVTPFSIEFHCHMELL